MIKDFSNMTADEAWAAQTNWMNKSSSRWTEFDMQMFISHQNSFINSDGYGPIKHSAEVLAKFADMGKKQTAKFIKVYNEVYSV